MISLFYLLRFSILILNVEGTSLDQLMYFFVPNLEKHGIMIHKLHGMNVPRHGC